jgi:hypothetical protein
MNEVEIDVPLVRVPLVRQQCYLEPSAPPSSNPTQPETVPEDNLFKDS